jgi:dinuclear metal center YbgI/SA1388 family protein
MATVRRVIEAIEALAPRRLALEGDATGLQVGDPEAEVSRVLCALDLTLAVAEEARALGAGLVVSHHAVVFRPLKELRTDGPGGRILAALIKGDVAVYVPHTALDVARGGTNDALAARLGLTEVTVLERTGRGADAELGIGRLGRLPAPGAADEVARRFKALLEAPYAHLVSKDASGWPCSPATAGATSRPRRRPAPTSSSRATSTTTRRSWPWPGGSRSWTSATGRASGRPPSSWRTASGAGSRAWRSWRAGSRRSPSASSETSCTRAGSTS